MRNRAIAFLPSKLARNRIRTNELVQAKVLMHKRHHDIQICDVHASLRPVHRESDSHKASSSAKLDLTRSADAHPQRTYHVLVIPRIFRQCKQELGESDRNSPQMTATAFTLSLRSMI
jgi:hypothetical protein